MSHMDVVPIEEITRPDWTHPPFAGVVSDGIIWGRGSLDDKIGVISLMESLELLLAQGNPAERGIYLAFGHDEEVAGIRTTTAATMISGSPKANILPTRSEAVINSRILPGETVETVKSRVIDLIDDPRVTVTAEYGNNPSPISPIDTRGYQIIARTIRAIDNDILVAPYRVRGGTDAKYFYSVSDSVYRFLMVRVNSETMRYVHGIDERVPVDDYLEAIRFNYHVMRQPMQE